MFGNLFSNLGNSNWWLGENSLFGQGLSTFADSGVEIGLPGGGSLGSGGPTTVTNLMQGGGEAEMLKYGMMGLLAYLVISKL